MYGYNTVFSVALIYTYLYQNEWQKSHVFFTQLLRAFFKRHVKKRSFSATSLRSGVKAAFFNATPLGQWRQKTCLCLQKRQKSHVFFTQLLRAFFKRHVKKRSFSATSLRSGVKAAFFNATPLGQWRQKTCLCLQKRQKSHVFFTQLLRAFFKRHVKKRRCQYRGV